MSGASRPSRQDDAEEGPSRTEMAAVEERVSYWSLPHKPQLAVLMLGRVAEPMAASSIQSYLFFQLRHFDPAATPATISAQAGLIFGAKTAAHVCTGLLWGRLADSAHGGRKLVLVFGLVASALAMIGYGFATSFAAAITWQIVEGALSGTVPMVRCVTAELNPQKPYRARALTLLPLCANAGHLLGPLIGGFMVTPDGERASNGLFATYPYAAPNIFLAIFHLVTALGVVLVLEETLDLARVRSNSSSASFSSSFSWKSWRTWGSSKQQGRMIEELDESTPLLVGNDDTSRSSSSSSSCSPSRQQQQQQQKKLPFRKLWTFNVVSTLVTYFIIHGHVGTFPSLWAIFLSTPTDVARRGHGPLRFYGGLGMDPRGVGTAMSLQGVLGVLLQVALYPTLNDRLGTLRLWRAGLFVFPVAYFLAPFCALVSYYATTVGGGSDEMGGGINDEATAGRALVWASVLGVLFLFVAGRTGVSPATTLLINDCTPHPSVRATIHTIATIVSSASRSVFPPAALAIFGRGLQIGVVGLGFWFIAGLAALACVASLWVVEGNNCEDLEEEIAEQGEENGSNTKKHGPARS